MIIRYNFNLSAWIKGVNIEADSEKEALDKLLSMSLADIVEQCEDSSVSMPAEYTNIDSEIVQQHLTVKLSDLAVNPFFIEYDNEFQKNELIRSVPTEDTFEIYLTEDDSIEDLIEQELCLKYEIFGDYTYKYEIVDRH